MNLNEAISMNICGVSGSGKSNLARLLHESGLMYIDTDSEHLNSAKRKIQAGLSPNEAERNKWLHRIGARMSAAMAYGDSVVADASALRRAYRDQLRDVAPVRFVLLWVPESLALDRVATRSKTDPAHLVQNRLAEFVKDQFRTLELPCNEPDVWVIDGRLPSSIILDLLRKNWIANSRTENSNVFTDEVEQQT